MGKALAAQGVKKACWVTWDYAAGKELGEGFRDGLRSGGGELVQVLSLPFPETNFQPILAQLPGLGVDAVGSFFAGGGAVQFVKDYAAAGLRDKLPLCGSGFLTEGVLKPRAPPPKASRPRCTTATAWTTPRTPHSARRSNRRPARGRCLCGARLRRRPDDRGGNRRDQGRRSRGEGAGGGNTSAKIDSPRGALTLSPSHNPVQTIYLREDKGGENRVIGVAAEALADSGTGCKLG